MFWIEMSRDPDHGGGDWAFSKSIWSPTKKRNGGKWKFWDNILSVKKGDKILHLRGKGRDTAFCGFSIAATDGFITDEKPPIPKGWGNHSNYYRVILENYSPLDYEIGLYKLFAEKEEKFKQYCQTHNNICLVYQTGRVQCLNGAYFSPLDLELFDLIFDKKAHSARKENKARALLRSEVEVGETISQRKNRVGQDEFARNVKLNFNGACCFPNCSINHNSFLVGSHIAAWADERELRGRVDNGLCLCVFHDKAFELGYFSLDDDFRVVVKRSDEKPDFIQKIIDTMAGEKISESTIKPSIEALEIHRYKHNL